jgi:protein arginine kinase
MALWLEGLSVDDDVAISTRVRVARNLSKYKFPSNMSIEDNDALVSDILNSAKDIMDSEYKYIRTLDLSKTEQQSYVEDHLISPNMVKKKDRSSFLLRKDERATIMINEEDHIRIQTLFSGLNLKKAWELCSKIDDELDRSLEYAYDEKLGYLTSCPTNVGTGLRASVMVHLPCITMTGNINSVVEGLRELGITVRGIYGEGSRALGNLYQISNQTTLGESEEEVMDKLDKVIRQIISKERSIRNYLRENMSIELQDKIYRSLGILKYSRILNSKESMKHLSNIRLGWELGILENQGYKDIIKVMIDIQPANIQQGIDKTLTEKERDVVRANIIREFILDMEG